MVPQASDASIFLPPERYSSKCEDFKIYSILPKPNYSMAFSIPHESSQNFHFLSLILQVQQNQAANIRMCSLTFILQRLKDLSLKSGLRWIRFNQVIRIYKRIPKKTRFIPFNSAQFLESKNRTIVQSEKCFLQRNSCHLQNKQKTKSHTSRYFTFNPYS